MTEPSSAQSPGAAPQRISGQRPLRGVRTLFTPFERLPSGISLGVSVGVTAAILVAWAIVSYGELVNPLFLPTPTKLVAGIIEMNNLGTLFPDIGISTYTITVGFVAAAVLSVPIGILMGTVSAVEAALEAPIGFIRYLPVTALIPLFILFIGIGIEAKIALIFYGTFFMLVLLIADLAANIRKELLETAFTLGCSRWSAIRRVVLPACMPGIVDSLRVSLGWAWTYLVVAELLASNQGLGYMILQGMRGLKTERIYAGILIIGVLGIIFDRAFRILHDRLFPWSERANR